MERAFTNDIYAGRDPRDIPLYPLGSAAHILSLSPATLGSWIRGRSYPRANDQGWFEPLINRPDPSDSRLSFLNLIEANVLAALRRIHSIPIKQVREAQEVAEQAHRVDRLFIREELLAAPGQLFLERYGELVSLNRSQQLAMKEILHKNLSRVVHEQGVATKFWPIPITGESSAKILLIDPRVSFGRPVVASKGIATAAIASRYSAGETVKDLAEDYDLEDTEVAEAISFEQLAA